MKLSNVAEDTKWKYIECEYGENRTKYGFSSWRNEIQSQIKWWLYLFSFWGKMREHVGWMDFVLSAGMGRAGIYRHGELCEWPENRLNGMKECACGVAQWCGRVWLDWSEIELHSMLTESHDAHSCVGGCAISSLCACLFFDMMYKVQIQFISNLVKEYSIFVGIELTSHFLALAFY